MDAGPICMEDEKPKVVCTPGEVQSCQTAATSQAPSSCAAGSQTCNAAGTGFGVCDDVLPAPRRVQRGFVLDLRRRRAGVWLRGLGHRGHRRR